MIFGVNQLTRFSPMEFDCRKLNMKFKKDKEEVMMQKMSAVEANQGKDGNYMENETSKWYCC